MTALVLAGCASLTETECRADAAGWQALGQYDAVQGDRPWIEAYARVCERHGVPVDHENYLIGWDDGYAEFIRRLGYTN